LKEAASFWCNLFFCLLQTGILENEVMPVFYRIMIRKDTRSKAKKDDRIKNFMANIYNSFILALTICNV